MTYGPGLVLVASALFAAFGAGVMPNVGPAPDAGAQAAGAIARHETPASRARPVLEPEVVEGCLGCHRDSLSLAEAEVEALAEAIAAIIRNEANHIVPIAALSEEDLMALAKALADPDAAE